MTPPLSVSESDNSTEFKSIFSLKCVLSRVLISTHDREVLSSKNIVE